LPLPRLNEPPGVPILIRGSRRPRDPEAPPPEQQMLHNTGRTRALDLLFGDGCDK